MTETLPDPPELDPAALASSDFTRSRRGLEATEVRATLGRAADALRSWELRDETMRHKIEELEARLSESHELDEQRIATVLGEETARIVTAAREAAGEIRAKAQEESERLRTETAERAEAAAEALAAEAQALRDEAAQVRDEAASDATALRESATTEAARVREEAAAEAAALREEAAAETAAIREEAAALATTTVSDAQIRRDQLLSEAESVLSLRTAEAESAAAEIAAAAAVALEAAEESAAATLAAAQADATDARDAADTEAAQILAAAREEGRTMVGEARDVRERMLGDLSSKRRTARRQIEGAIAGRDRVLEIIVDAAEQVSATISELEAADDEATAAADAAAEALEDDTGEVPELAELGETLARADDSGDGPGPAPAAAVDEHEPLVAAGSAEPEDATTGPAEDRVGIEGEAAGEGATVHDLFARIRAQGLDEDGSDEDALAEIEAEEDAAADRDGDRPDTGEVLVAAGGESAIGASIDLTDEPAAGTAGTEASADLRDDSEVDDDAQVDPMSAEAIFDRRDTVLQPVEKNLSRILKRLASDEQNEILDRLRRVKRGRPDPEQILPSADHGHFVGALSDEFAAAAALGASFWSELAGAPESATVDQEALKDALEQRVADFVSLHRTHLERTFSEAEESDLDAGELADRVRATYRDWRSASLSDFAGDLVTAGFALGERQAAGPGTPWRWVVDHGGLPCADGEDNALAGAVPCEEPFPTGDVTPPAHPGCRCLLAPAHS